MQRNVCSGIRVDSFYFFISISMSSSFNIRLKSEKSTPPKPLTHIHSLVQKLPITEPLVTIKYFPSVGSAKNKNIIDITAVNKIKTMVNLMVSPKLFVSDR